MIDFYVRLGDHNCPTLCNLYAACILLFVVSFSNVVCWFIKGRAKHDMTIGNFSSCLRFAFYLR